MTNTILIIIGIAVLVILILSRRKTLRQAQDKIAGICEVALEQKSQKEENKNKILDLLQKQNPASAQGSGVAKELSNSKIREALGFSERSVVRYMEELEKADKVEQIGETGRNVVYRVKSKDHAASHVKL